MAKPTRKARGVEHIDFKYQCAQELPWEELESECGTTFDDQQREEIYHCLTRYYWEDGFYSAGVSNASYEDFDSRLRLALIELGELAEFFSPGNRLDGIADEAKAASVIHSTIKFGELRIGDGLDAINETAVKILDALETSDRSQIETSAVTPHLAGLRAFIKTVVAEATYQESRSKESIEFSRWGIPVGPQSIVFWIFTNILIGEKFSENQIRDAWRAAIKDSP